MTDVSRPLSINHPPIIECGVGVASKVAEWAKTQGAETVLVVADAFNAGRVDLLGFGPGITVEVFGDVVPEPDNANLEKLLALAGNIRPDLVVGFGGGSAMDLAKLAAVLGDGDQTLGEVVGAHLVKGRRPLLAQVPTTAGTGSEGGTRSLVTDTENARKMAVESLHMLADMVALDPQTTVSLPPDITAATGVDALAHCVESYTNIKAHPAIDVYATEGIRLIGRYLARAVENGNDLEARTALSLASLYGGFCLGPVNTAAGHAVAYPLGTRHHIPHGHANAVIFPHVLTFNAEIAPERTAFVLECLGTKGEDAAYRFCQNLGIEMRMGRLGVPESDLEAMADEAFAIKRLLDNNPREVSREDILGIYKSAF